MPKNTIIVGLLRVKVLYHMQESECLIDASTTSVFFMSLLFTCAVQPVKIN